MLKYHKIQSIFKRGPKGQFLIGEWATPALEYLKDLKWLWDEKIDGTNIRVHWDGCEVRFGGRTDNAAIPARLITTLQDRFPIQKFTKHYPTSALELYGEGYGAKIQKGGGNYRSDTSFCLFDVRCGGFWLKREALLDIARTLNIEVAPVIGEGTIKEAIAYAQGGFESAWGTFKAEGLVLRPSVQLFDRQGHRIITKVKHKDFLNQ